MFKGLFNKGLDVDNRNKNLDIDENTNDMQDMQEDMYKRTETLYDEPLSDMDFMDIYSGGDTEPVNVSKQDNNSYTGTVNHEYNDVGYVHENHMDLFNDDMYSVQDANVQDTIEIDDKKFKDVLKHLSKRGYTITFTGNHGCGTSTIACNTAYTLGKLGFKVILLDLDTLGRNQHYLTKDNFNSIEKDAGNMSTALDGRIDEVYGCITSVRRNVHAILNGIACEPHELAPGTNERVKQMINLFKKDYDFIILDVPFKFAVEDIPVTLEACNDIVITCDSSSWGVMNLINYICNLEDTMLLEILFSQKTNLLFNKHKGVKKIYNRGINLYNSGALKVLDKIVVDIADFSIGYKFADMRTMGALELSNTFETFLGEKAQFCDTPKGQVKMLELLKKLLVK